MKAFVINEIEIEKMNCVDRCPYKMQRAACSSCDECFLEDASKGVKLRRDQDGRYLRTIECLKRNAHASILHKFFVYGEEGLNEFEKNIKEDMLKGLIEKGVV